MLPVVQNEIVLVIEDQKDTWQSVMISVVFLEWPALDLLSELFVLLIRQVFAAHELH